MTLIELPEVAADGRLSRTIGVTKGQEGLNRAFGMNPTQGIEKPCEVELSDVDDVTVVDSLASVDLAYLRKLVTM